MQNEGQYSIFDVVKDTRPCAYRFKRYIGQKVAFWYLNITGTVIEIEPYYTIIATDQGTMAGTPTTICPVKDPGQQN